MVVVGVAAVRWGGWWRVSQVTVFGNHHLPSEWLTQLTQIVSGANILRIDLGGIRDWVVKSAWVKDARVSCSLWSRCVKVIVVEREPVGRVQLEGGTAVWVDAEGFVLGSAEGAALVGVHASNHPARRVHPEVACAAEALRQAGPDFLSSFPVFDASDPANVVAHGAGGLTVQCGPIGKLPQTLAILERLWERTEFELAAYAEVDLRWEDQVILKPR
ncbi:MAG: cell division protein FtsQ/DivIB [Candidatus Bipolaricaulaceae bacterium]